MPEYCRICSQYITRESMYHQILDNFYHIKCFNCQKCGTNLMYKPFVKKADGKLYCMNECEEPIVLPPISNDSKRSGPNKMINYEPFPYNINELILDPPSPSVNKNSPDYAIPKIVNNGFHLKKPLRPKPAPEPFFYNYSDQIMEINTKKRPKYTLNNPLASQSLNEFDKNMFLTREKKMIVFKSKSLKSKTNEPFSYNKETNDVNLTSSLKRSNTELIMSKEPPYALHSNYLEVLGNKQAELSNKNNDFCHKCNFKINDSRDGFSHKNKMYHKTCVKCFRCRNELYNMKNIYNDPKNEDRLCCEYCYNDVYANRCFRCNEPIAAYMLSHKHENKYYHKECFSCFRCKKFTNNEQYFKVGKIIICRSCL
jgi:hypothetical protein